MDINDINEDIKENIEYVMCGYCKWFKVNADRVESICKRLDHKKYQFTKPWFRCYDCGQFNKKICNDFEPAKLWKYLFKHWTSFDDFIGEISENEIVSLTINGDNSIWYKVKYKDFANGTFIDEKGELKWIEKCYFKKCKVTEKNPIGYILVREISK